MAKRTATIERYHVHGTPNHCLAMFYGRDEITPRESPMHVGHRAMPAWIPDDAAGMARIRKHARKLGFTHVKYVGDWNNKPIGGKL